MAARGGSKAAMAAVKGGGANLRAAVSKGKSKGKPKEAAILPASELGKFLSIPETARSDTSKLISKFIKLNNRQNPGMKKNAFSEDKLKSLLSGKDRIGIPEIAKLLSGQFVKGG